MEGVEGSRWTVEEEEEEVEGEEEVEEDGVRLEVLAAEPRS